MAMPMPSPSPAASVMGTSPSETQLPAIDATGGDGDTDAMSSSHHAAPTTTMLPIPEESSYQDEVASCEDRAASAVDTCTAATIESASLAPPSSDSMLNSQSASLLILFGSVDAVDDLGAEEAAGAASTTKPKFDNFVDSGTTRSADSDGEPVSTISADALASSAVEEVGSGAADGTASAGASPVNGSSVVSSDEAPPPNGPIDHSDGEHDYEHEVVPAQCCTVA
jgi:hypothetical protein